MRNYSLIALLIAAMLVISACSAEDHASSQGNETPRTINNQQPSQPSAGNDTEEEVHNIEDAFSTEDVTLRLYSHYAAINNANDVEAIFGPVTRRYPNIAIELVRGQTLYDMLASGEIPDLVAVAHYHMGTLLPLEVGMNMDDEFVEKFNVDLDRFVPQVIDAIRSYGENGELLSIPYTLNYGLLLYNKDIFDRFGVEYPIDGLTWDETLDLAKSLTRLDEGVQYIGIDPGSERTIVRGLSAPTVNEAGSQALFNTEPYQKVFTMLRDFYRTPGVVRDDGNYSWGWNYVLQEQTVAMFPTWIAATTSRLAALEEEGGGMEWDIAAHPVFAETPQYGREVSFQSLMVPPTAENKDAALQVIWSLISDEVQEEMNRGYNLTVLDRPDLQNEFAADTRLFEGKNLKGVFSVKPAPTPRPSRFDIELFAILKEEFQAVIREGKDVNSALRDANEKANAYIQTENK